MKRTMLALIILTGVSFLAVADLWPAAAHERYRPPVYGGHRPLEITIIGDERGYLPIRRTGWDEGGRFAPAGFVVEAQRGERYAIRIRNLTGRRLGVVMSVDGRNVLTGDSSHGGTEEGMYILPAYGESQISGWRANLDRVNRFYFTSPEDSYAGRVGDSSRSGEIAVTAYYEREILVRPPVAYDSMERKESLAPSPQARSKAGASPMMECRPDRDSRVGTGYGESSWSPASAVSFEPEGAACASYFIRCVWGHQIRRHPMPSPWPTPDRPMERELQPFTPPPRSR